MSKSFRPGLKYVFTKKAYIRDCGKKSYKKHRSWIDEINGREVSVLFTTTGYVRYYTISPEWCKCIGKKVGEIK